MNFAPIHIETLIICATKKVPYSDLNSIAMERLIAEGLVETDSTGFWTASERGYAWIRQLCNLPLPIQKWVQP